MGYLMPWRALILKDILDNAEEPDVIKFHIEFFSEFTPQCNLGCFSELDSSPDCTQVAAALDGVLTFFCEKVTIANR